MCKVHRRTGHVSGVTTFISSIGEHNLKLAVLCMKYLKHIGRLFGPHSVSRPQILGFQQQKKAVESHDRSLFTAPVFTNKMLEKEQDRVWEQLDEYLLSVRDDNGIPLVAWTRATTKLFPKVAAEDDWSNYITRDSELVERALVVQERFRGQTNTDLEVTCLWWTEVFQEGKLILFAKLQQMLGGLGICNNAKKTQRLRDGRRAYLVISNALFGDNIVFFRSEANRKDIQNITYNGKKRNFGYPMANRCIQGG